MYPIRTRFGRFSVERRLTATAISEIYLVYDYEKYEELNQKYYAVIKINLVDEFKANMHTLQNEVNILRRLYHPGIIRLFPLREYDGKMRYVLFDTGDICYFAMEYIEHGSLDSHLRTIHTPRFDFLWRLEFFYQLVSIVHYLHENGYAHLDLKPENILLRFPPEPDQVPIPVLIDFGSTAFVDVLDRDITATRRYAAPEVLELIDYPDMPSAKQQVIPAKADVWALGALMFEILTGQPLISRATKSLASTHRNRSYRTITELAPNVPDTLNRLLSRMIREEAAKRLSTANILEALQEVLPEIQPPRLAD